MENRQAQIPIQNIQNMLNDIRRRYPTTYRPAFQSLNECLGNIIQHPDEVSYRIINLIDHFIQNNILIIPEILDILRLIGFSQTQTGSRNILMYQNQPVNLLNNYISLFNNFLAQAQTPQPQRQRTFQDPRIQNRNLPNPSRPYNGPNTHNIHQNNNINRNNICNRLIDNRIKENNVNIDNKGYNNININNHDNRINNNNKNDMNNNRVVYFIYDLSGGIVKGLSQAILGKEIEGIYHTSVYVYGKEYYYSGGINKSAPRKTQFGIPIKEINFGYTNKTQKEFESYLRSISSSFTSQNYNLISHNCNHFSDTALFFLTGNHLPSHILKQHEEILKTPLGRQVRPYLEAMSGNGNGRQNIENNPLMILPFLLGNVINNPNLMGNNQSLNNRNNSNNYRTKK